MHFGAKSQKTLRRALEFAVDNTGAMNFRKFSKQKSDHTEPVTYLYIMSRYARPYIPHPEVAKRRNIR